MLRSAIRSVPISVVLAFLFSLAATFALLSHAAHGQDLQAQPALYQPDVQAAPAAPALASAALQLVAAPVPLSLQAGSALPVVPSVDKQTPAAAPALPDPLNEPLGFWDAVKDLRRTGGLWAALALGLAAVFAAARARAVPRPGEPEPAPTSWRARSIAIFAGVAAVLAAGGDMLLGLGNWAALFTTVVASASLIWRAFNPPKGSSPAVAS